ncbi:MAG: hypothetical protein KA818_11720 [Methanoculleus sp.]|nr:hypothetical protein [Methanoculleus sp.]
MAGGDPFEETWREHADVVGWSGDGDMDNMLDQNACGQRQDLARSCGVPY